MGLFEIVFWQAQQAANVPVTRAGELQLLHKALQSV